MAGKATQNRIKKHVEELKELYVRDRKSFELKLSRKAESWGCDMAKNIDEGKFSEAAAYVERAVETLHGVGEAAFVEYFDETIDRLFAIALPEQIYEMEKNRLRGKSKHTIFDIRDNFLVPVDKYVSKLLEREVIDVRYQMVQERIRDIANSLDHAASFYVSKKLIGPAYVMNSMSEIINYGLKRV